MRRSAIPSMRGSSPRVWGTYPDPVDVFVNRRFIPTCVGNIAGLEAGVRCSPVHPHVCGEHLVMTPRWVYLIGSSPRVWGTFVALEHSST